MSPHQSWVRQTDCPCHGWFSLVKSFEFLLHHHHLLQVKVLIDVLVYYVVSLVDIGYIGMGAPNDPNFKRLHFFPMQNLTPFLCFCLHPKFSCFCFCGSINHQLSEWFNIVKKKKKKEKKTLLLLTLDAFDN